MRDEHDNQAKAQRAGIDRHAGWDRHAWDLEPDSIALALDALSPRTAGAIIREAFYGTRRFDEFLRYCNVSPSLLSARLRTIVADDLLVKVPYREFGSRVRDEYRLTDKGRDLVQILVALNDWADRWLLAPEDSTVTLAHRGCGARVHAVIRCEHGHDVLRAADIAASPGPGARPAQ